MHEYWSLAFWQTCVVRPECTKASGFDSSHVTDWRTMVFPDSLTFWLPFHPPVTELRGDKVKLYLILFTTAMHALFLSLLVWTIPMGPHSGDGMSNNWRNALVFRPVSLAVTTVSMAPMSFSLMQFKLSLKHSVVIALAVFVVQMAIKVPVILLYGNFFFAFNVLTDFCIGAFVVIVTAYILTPGDIRITKSFIKDYIWHIATMSLALCLALSFNICLFLFKLGTKTTQIPLFVAFSVGLFLLKQLFLATCNVFSKWPQFSIIAYFLAELLGDLYIHLCFPSMASWYVVAIVCIIRFGSNSCFILMMPEVSYRIRNLIPPPFSSSITLDAYRTRMTIMCFVSMYAQVIVPISYMFLATWLRYGNNSAHYVFVKIPEKDFQNTIIYAAILLVVCLASWIINDVCLRRFWHIKLWVCVHNVIMDNPLCVWGSIYLAISISLVILQAHSMTWSFVYGNG